MQQCEEENLNSLLVKIIRLHFGRTFTVYSKLGLYRGQPPVLSLLWEKDGRKQSEIAEELHLKPSTITSVIKSIEKSGFVERRADFNDKRVIRVFLTKKGIDIKKDVDKVREEINEECFKNFNCEEKKLLQGYFNRMIENLLEASQNKMD